MRFITLFAFILGIQSLLAQTFTDVSYAFDGVINGSMAFADVNNDSYQDILVTGSSYGGKSAKLYINDGNGKFMEKTNHPFEKVEYSAVAFADVNGDTYPDVLITGSSTSFSPIAKLYLNDGSGNFLESTGPTLFGVYWGSAAFADINGDTYPDIFLTGRDSLGGFSAKLYTNDGNGNFSELPDTTLAGVWKSSVDFADVNGDGTLDLLLTGREGNSSGITRLYLNDGSGHFSNVIGTPLALAGVQQGAAGFVDINGDTHPDALITGSKGSSTRIAKLYMNDGNGNFTEVMNTPFDGVVESDIAFADVNQDTYPDIFITGINHVYKFIAKLYINDGSGNFTEQPNTSFEGVRHGAIIASDVNGDNYPEVFVTGEDSTSLWIAKLYDNDGAGNFSESDQGVYLEGISFSSVAFADVNSDNYPDALIMGSANTFVAKPNKLYINDGHGGFDEMENTPFTGMAHGDIAFADVNQDTYPDVLITGSEGGTDKMTKLYINDGSGAFQEKVNQPLTGLVFSAADFADVNGDTYLDVLITGQDSSNEVVAKLYTNDGTGNFMEVPNTPFEGAWRGSVAFADIDGDTYPEVMITGSGMSKLYQNDGSGNFSEILNTPFDGVGNSSIAFADVNGDTYLDVLITGGDTTGTPSANLYINDGSGNFSKKANTPFAGVTLSSMAFADVNADTYPDVLITGRDSTATPIAKLYLNDGSGNFTEALGEPFHGVFRCSIAFADVNQDNYPDVLITGESENNARISKLYLNKGNPSSIKDNLTQNHRLFSVYPNPTKDGQINLEYISEKNQKITISLMDLNGKTLSQQQKAVAGGTNLISLNYGRINQGLYIIMVKDDQFSFSGKVIFR